MKKLLSIVLAALMLCPAFAVIGTALEGPDVSLIIAGVEVTSANAADIKGEGISGKVSFDFETSTLTLNNAKITKSSAASPDVTPIYISGNVNIELVGKNSVIGENDDEHSYTDGICCYGELGITSAEGSKGSLIVSSGEANYDNGSNYGWSYGIYSDGNIKIENCTVTVEACESLGGAMAIDSDKNLYIINSTVTAIAGAATKEEYDGGESIGIYSEYNTEITNSTVKVTASNASYYSCATKVYDGNLYIEGSTVTAIAGEADYSYGIYAEYDAEIIESTVTATSGDAGYFSRGIAAGFIDVDDSTVKGVSGDLGDSGDPDDERETAGICAYDSEIYFDNSVITATAGDAGEYGFSAGIEFYNGGTLYADAKSVTAIGEDCAIYGEVEFTEDISSIRVNTKASSFGASKWDGKTDLGGENSPYKYVKLSASRSIFEIIIEFFRSIFSFIGKE